MTREWRHGDGVMVTPRTDERKTKEDEMSLTRAREQMIERNRNAWKTAPDEEREPAERSDEAATPPSPSAARARMIERHRNAWRGDRS